jgi:hypothetical protein
MATGTVITVKGIKRFFPTEIIPFLESAKKTYRIDAAGMEDGGMCLTSSFVSYCDLDLMSEAMRSSGQEYKGTARQYAAIYNSLFEIDC